MILTSGLCSNCIHAKLVWTCDPAEPSWPGGRCLITSLCIGRPLGRLVFLSPSRRFEAPFVDSDPPKTCRPVPVVLPSSVSSTKCRQLLRYEVANSGRHGTSHLPRAAHVYLNALWRTRVGLEQSGAAGAGGGRRLLPVMCGSHAAGPHTGTLKPPEPRRQPCLRGTERNAYVCRAVEHGNAEPVTDRPL